MDRVQFNNEVVNLRKLVKRVKVLIAHSLTRHITKLRTKKGSELQIQKNKRRVERFVAEIEAMKNLQADTVTKKAVTIKKTLQEVLNNPKSSARDRVLARIVYHKLIQEKVSQFKDMVTKDFFRTGTKKYKRLRKSKFESEVEARLKEEEDYQITLERMMSADKMENENEDLQDDDGNHDNEDDDDDDEYSQKFAEKMKTFVEMGLQDDDGNQYNEDDDNCDKDEVSRESRKKMRTLDKTDQDDDDDEYSQQFSGKLRTSDRIDHDNDTNDSDTNDMFDEESHSREKMLIRKLMDGDSDSSDESDSSQSDYGDQVTRPSPQKPKAHLEPVVGEKERLKSEVAQRISEDAAFPEKSHSSGKRKFDSMFLGSLSSMQDDDVTEMLHKTKEEPTKQRSKAKPAQKQHPKARPSQETRQKPGKMTRQQRVPMVDQPNLVRHTQGEKLIPGINCHPELPPRHALRDTHEAKSGKKPFSGRPEGKQLPTKPLTGQSRQPTQGKHPTSATVSSQKKPAVKESLHPSWEASKKRKEESKIVPFQGKKITFDDD